MQSKGLGGQVLLAAETGGSLLVIDARNDRAAAWYDGYGALRLEDMSLKLVLPLATIRLALEATDKL